MLAQTTHKHYLCMEEEFELGQISDLTNNRAMSDSIPTRLNQLLADYSVFYQKLRIYHWTVKGPMFFQLHNKFEEMYDAAALAVDEIAERIVGIGARPLGRLADFVSTSSLSEADGSPEASEMVRNLIADQRSLVAGLRQGSSEAAEAGDTLTANMLEEMADAEEKSAWMLEAYLG